ncbi:MAG: hypothetical protein FWG34_08430 [Oscillospiraceae bacterium]|nr:hypothetical protein [Oscillospiraceae bacterium]
MIFKDFRKILSVFAVFALLSALSCGDGALKFKNDGDTGNLIDEENGRYYIYCRGYLQAAAIKPALYARGDRGEKLYEVDGLDPAKWLSEDISQGIAFLFREEGTDEPKFAEFETEKIVITMTEEISVAIGQIVDPETVAMVVSDYIGNKSAPYPEIVEDWYNFLFESKKHSGIYYVLQYLVDEKNNAFLFNRWTGRCVSCGYKMFAATGTD